MCREIILLNKLFLNNTLDKEEIVELLDDMDTVWTGTLFRYAARTRDLYYGKQVFMRGLIEFSNYCNRNCMYCGLRRDNQHADRYRLSKDEILDCCLEGYSLGYRTFVLQSGEDDWYRTEEIVDIIRSIKQACQDVAVTLSIGERSYEDYKAFYDAGADRYLLRHETASAALYKKLHPDMSYGNRVKCLHNLKEIGYQVGAGFMVGLPWQTNEDLAEDLMFLKELAPDMIGIGPFIAHNDTPLKDFAAGTLQKTLIMVALARLFVPDALIPSTTALGTISSQGREKALKAGANVVMPNLSPVAVRSKYEIYPDKICTGDEAAHCRQCIEGRIRSTGLDVNLGRGDSLRRIHLRPE